MTLVPLVTDWRERLEASVPINSTRKTSNVEQCNKCFDCCKLQVSYAAPEVTKTIQPEVTVQQHEYQYKSVPVAVPVAAPYQAEPIITHYNLPPTYSYEAFRGYPAFGYPHAYSHFAPAAAAVIQA